jgi:serine/threonine protein kinase
VSPSLDPYALIGTEFRNQYLVEGFAGAGRFSAVYRATDGVTERKVSLRLLNVKPTLAPNRRARVIERLRVLTRPASEVASACPAFADVLDVIPFIASRGAARGRWMPAVVQTWLEGETLENVLARERAPRMPIAQAIDLLAPVADALGYAHARGVVHGGLSPRTLFVRAVPELVPTGVREQWSAVAIGRHRDSTPALSPFESIVDLGLAQALARTQDEERPFAEPPFGALHFFAPTYRSPEHHHGDAAALVPASDVFALALIVAELLSGAAPASEDDEPVSVSGLGPLAASPFAARSHALGYVEAVFARALAPRASDRFASVAAFWEALRTAARMTALRPSARSARPPSLPGSERPYEPTSKRGSPPLAPSRPH